MLRSVVALTSVLALVLTGCSTTAETGTADSSGPREVDKILVDYPFTALPVYAALQTATKAYADQQGVEVVFTNDNMDLSTQVTNLTTHLRQDEDAVVCFPADPASIESIAKQYRDAGKYWVTYGGDLKNQDSTLQFSFEKSGQMLGENAGQWAVEHLGGQGTVLILEDMTIQLGQERTKGIVDGLKKAAPNLKIVAQQQAITPEQGLSVTNAVLSKNPDIDIVLAAAGDAAQGAYQALLSKGRAATDAKTYVGGLDGNLFLFQQMKAGHFVRALVTVKTEDIAKAIVDIPRALGEGKTDIQTDVPVYLVTPDSADLDEYIATFGG
ncbi:sugar ABC transporter substrate-binding protein [Cryptosporangium aurantiacum]|uniref:Ribose transport system substrate-binding protein n=1 Tax=Cryptosporangium aurantiacum TaxID=134849 RepID=A0A1M7R181_9ACTN|nr:sugar ABC transporter substrate-binding protein [Cryptosporangium aurantiacum]SHN38165.1 ribose transport system substrate-binding protein [Cryptosporangium aurantiacum]